MWRWARPSPDVRNVTDDASSSAAAPLSRREGGRIAAALLQRSGDALRQWWRLAVSAARLAIGVPDYDTYVQHMRLNHPEQTPMTYEEFYKNRVDARYGGKGNARCC